jgi:hypothetical protein
MEPERERERQHLLGRLYKIKEGYLEMEKLEAELEALETAKA